jgi:hypothetical protein
MQQFTAVATDRYMAVKITSGKEEPDLFFVMTTSPLIVIRFLSSWNVDYMLYNQATLEAIHSHVFKRVCIPPILASSLPSISMPAAHSPRYCFTSLIMFHIAAQILSLTSK